MVFKFLHLKWPHSLAIKLAKVKGLVIPNFGEGGTLVHPGRTRYCGHTLKNLMLYTF